MKSHNQFTENLLQQFFKDHDFENSLSSLPPHSNSNNIRMRKTSHKPSIQSTSLQEIISDNQKTIEQSIETIIHSFFQENEMNKATKTLQKESKKHSPTPKSVTPFSSDVSLPKVIDEHSIPVTHLSNFKLPENNHLLLYPTIPIPISVQKSFSISKKMRQCIICDKKMAPHNVKKHFFENHNQNWKFCPFRCQEMDCGKGFTSGFNYSRHTESNAHKNQRARTTPVLCPSPGCGKYIRGSKYGLKVHMYTHNNQWPFRCHFGDCGRGCRSRSDLKMHMKVHTGEKPFKCELCGHCLKSKKDLKVHLKFQHGQLLFSARV